MIYINVSLKLLNSLLKYYYNLIKLFFLIILAFTIAHNMIRDKFESGFETSNFSSSLLNDSEYSNETASDDYSNSNSSYSSNVSIFF